MRKSVTADPSFSSHLEDHADKQYSMNLKEG